MSLNIIFLQCKKEPPIAAGTPIREILDKLLKSNPTILVHTIRAIGGKTEYPTKTENVLKQFFMLKVCIEYKTS